MGRSSRIKRYVSDGKEYAYFRPTPAQRMLGARPVRLISDDPETEVAALIERIESGEVARDKKRFERHAREIYRKARKRAEVRGIPFALTVDDVMTALERSQLRCEVTDLPFRMEVNVSAYRQPFRPSIDRIDAAGGYTPDNIRIVCVAVNAALSDWGDEVFWKIVEGAKRRRRRGDLSRPTF